MSSSNRPKFKHIQSYRSQIRENGITFNPNGVSFSEDIFLTFRIYDTDFFAKIEEGKSYNFSPPSDRTFWLYANIDFNGQLVLKYTTVSPTSSLFGDDFPVSSSNGRLFYNRTLDRMFQFNVGKWVEHDAVIIAEINKNLRVVDLFKNYSQAGYPSRSVNDQDFAVDSRKTPIKVFKRDSYTFLTESQYKKLNFRLLKNMEVAPLLHRSRAGSTMESMTVVHRGANYSLSPCSTLTTFPAFGLVLEDAQQGEEVTMLEKGFYYTRHRQWPHPPNTKLYYGTTGLLTVNPPDLNNSKSAQCVGHIVDLNTIYFDPEINFVLES